MACPFFYPVRWREETSFAIQPRLPLGGFFEGECRAAVAPFSPDPLQIDHACANGYARASCGRFPQDAPVDAVRFHATEREGPAIEIQYVFEKQCWPAGHGVLRYFEEDAGFEAPHADPIVQRQAEAYVESYLRRR